MGPISESAKLLVLNAGSSSLKFKLFSVAPLAANIGGLIERIGDVANSTLVAKQDPGMAAAAPAQKWREQTPVQDHVMGMELVLRFLRDVVSKDVARDVVAVGHRVVHGLDIHSAVLLDLPALAKIKEATALAPLHNPPGLQGIEAAQKVFPGVPQVGVFDTAYHQTMPPSAFMYGLPYEYYERHAVRRYGFHGTSHMYLAQRAAVLLGKPADQLNAITCHLGNGSSITAIQGGHSVDTSMGLTPLEGLLMGTRAGDMDPAIPLHMMGRLGLSAKDMDTVLNKKSGLLGVCGASDLRAVLEMRAKGEERGTLALDMFVYRVRKYIGAYTAALGGQVDAIVFSAGIGENSSIIRALIAERLEPMGLELDRDANDATVGGAEGLISTPTSKVSLLVIPTDEELSIAQQTLGVVHGTRGTTGGAAAA